MHRLQCFPKRKPGETKHFGARNSPESQAPNRHLYFIPLMRFSGAQCASVQSTPSSAFPGLTYIERLSANDRSRSPDRYFKAIGSLRKGRVVS
ncbi:hypothetical protein PAXRUDRAFT_828195 [Paxillus rubicundulus Ve08.2h10]|uniref:Uncharacterized protein n=1 Tax=Paxillus rubicundulus Ve08.2h10 TaxID=930991 RepID=A0A0D0DAS7_9AGAM|nr:hypothetical protein PAXRUDRAFT_828195 [Paxillus rubicundulus Ve08.2h10]